MIPNLSPAAMFGRTGLLSADTRHFAMSGTLSFAGGEPARAALIYAADDSLAFLRRRARGDLALYARGGVDQSGAFEPVCRLQWGGKVYVGGRLLDNGDNARAVVFAAEAGPNPVWRQIVLGIEGTKGTSGFRGIVGLASNGSQIVALSSTGEVAVSDDGDDWDAYANVGFSSSATALAGGAPGFIAVGNDGQLFGAVNPRSAWTSYNSAFSGSAIAAALCVGSVFVIAGGAKLASRTGLGAFTARSLPGSPSLDKLLGVSGRYFAGGVATWLTSTDALTWSDPGDDPYKGAESRARSGYQLDGTWFVHWGNGGLSTSVNGQNWTALSEPGLPSSDYMTVAFGI